MPFWEITTIILSTVLGVLITYFYLTKFRISIDTTYLQALWEVERLILSTLNFDEVAQKVTDIILTELGYLKFGYQIVVLALVDEYKGVLKRVAISKTNAAQKFLSTTPVPFHDIEISIQEKNNISIQALNENDVKFTHRVADVLYPAIDANFSDRLQKELGIKCSMVMPIIVNKNRLGILIFSMTKDESKITPKERVIIQSFSQAVGISLQNAILYTSLGKTKTELEEANVRLKELDQLKDEFVSVASHELRTPMTAIKSYTWMALHRADIPLTEKMKKYLSRTLLSTERLINLVNDMLNVSRIEAGRIEINPKAFDIVGLVKDVVDEVNPRATEQGLHLSIVDTQTPKVFADPDKIHEVLLNLVGNALKFTPSGGNITISFFSDGQVVETSVKDSGSGIARDDLGRLFQKFGRLDNSYISMGTSAGTGLGLYISKNLIELMHGKIWAQSEGLGRGATFSFSLPVASQELLAQAEKYHIKPKGETKELEPVAI